MMIKANIGNGEWKLFQAGTDVEFQSSQKFTDVEPDYDYDYWSDDRFPKPDEGGRFYVYYPSYEESGQIMDNGRIGVRWVTWVNQDARQTLVTDGPVYILNDQGTTVEALR